MAAVKMVKTKPMGKETSASLEHYFAQLTGTEEPDIEIIKPKITRLESNVRTIVSTMTTFTPIVRGLGYEKDADALDVFVSRAKEYQLVFAEAKSDEVAKSWMAIKGHDFVQTCMVACGNLAVIHAHLASSWAAVDRKFMNRFTGLTLSPFLPWCEIDFKRLWLIDGDTQPELRELLFTVLKNVFNAMRDMYDVYMSPDVDISQISKLIIDALAGLQKHIPRCEKAFKKIEESARMLNENFGEYYRDFLQTRDPNNIFTAFISDVSTNCGNDTQLIFQCRKIVEFYRKNAQKAAASGQLSGERREMFDALLRNYKILDKNAAEATGCETNPEDDGDLGGIDAPPAKIPETPEEDARDLDELMSQIENPKVNSIATKPTKPAKGKKAVKSKDE